VDEIPAYPPAGAGPHLWLLVEKRGRTTRDVARDLARLLGVDSRDAGWAGMKDRQAVTTQWLSFPSMKDPDPSSLAGEGFLVRQASRHQNKLKPGHSRGNRFSLVIHGGDAAKAVRCAAALAERGLPNAFGAQRFGREGENAAVGKALLTGAAHPLLGKAKRDRFLRRLCLSAYQSLLFNRWLAERLRDGLFATAILGDVMKKLETGGLFDCGDPALDAPRILAFEISPAGPMFGHKLRPATAGAGEREARLLAAEGITLSAFARGGGEAEGTRRAARVRVNASIEPAGDGYRASFELPKGSYATVVMGELMKGGAELDEGDE
jgi:tRNA pseudouridine13 synthase